MIDLDKTEIKGAGISLWFKVVDADVLFNRLKEHNVSIIKPIEDGPFGRMFIFRDPNGYAITIHGGQ